MNIELYPTYNRVFTDEQLKGIFYPLCAVELNDENQTKLFFVSSNGVWINEKHSSDNNNRSFTKFSLVENKYEFNGNIELYEGYEIVKEIFEKLENDFEKNGEDYLKSRCKTNDYIDKLKPEISIEKKSDFDLDYYLQTFYEYSINRLHYQMHNEFGAFRKIIDHWGAAEEKSPIVYEVSSNNNSSFADIEINAEYLFGKSIKLSDYEKIGQVIGFEFFTDGNDNILLFNKNDNTVLSINSYS